MADKPLLDVIVERRLISPPWAYRRPLVWRWLASPVLAVSYAIAGSVYVGAYFAFSGVVLVIVVVVGGPVLLVGAAVVVWALRTLGLG